MQVVLPPWLRGGTTCPVLWSLVLASEIFYDVFAYCFGGEKLDRLLSTKAKFQKEHGRGWRGI